MQNREGAVRDLRIVADDLRKVEPYVDAVDAVQAIAQLKADYDFTLLDGAIETAYDSASAGYFEEAATVLDTIADLLS